MSVPPVSCRKFQETVLFGEDQLEKKPTIIVYRDILLNISEGFVLSQGEALKDFVPHYFGSRLVTGLNVPLDRRLVLNRRGVRGNCAEMLFKLCGFAPRFSRAIRRLKPVLLHAHFGVDGAFILPVASAMHVPLVVTFHGYDATMHDAFARNAYFGLRLYVRRREELNREARLFIAVSGFIKRQLVERGFSEDKVLVHYMGVDVDLFRPDPNVCREPVILFVGRLSEEKGCEHLIRAVAKVQESVRDVKMVVIGEGVLRTRLERMAGERLLRYEFMGSQKQTVVRYWMNRARVLCVPSVAIDTGQAEAFGLVFAESQAMGLPVVSVATGGIPEAVAHGETGFLADKPDDALLAKYICLLITDRELLQRFSVAGRKRVESMFNLRRQTDELENVYRSIQAEAMADACIRKTVSWETHRKRGRDVLHALLKLS